MKTLKSHLFVIGCILVSLPSHVWAQNLPFGQTQTGTIASAAQSNTYTFTASANVVVDFTMATTSGSLFPRIRLFNPDGTLLRSAGNFGACASVTELNTVKLPATGTYTVLVSDCLDTNTGNYAIYAQSTNRPIAPIPVRWGQVQAGVIGKPTQSDTYIFSGSANDVVSFTMVTTSGSLFPRIRLHNPDGTLLSSAGNFGGCASVTELNTVKLPATGTYTVLVGDCLDTNTGNYNFSSQCLPGPCPILALLPGDFDGDRKADFAVFRPSNGTWFVIPSSAPNNAIIQQWGASGDIPVRGDYDGDGKTDFAVWRPSTGTWFIIPSSNPSAPIVQQWGTQGDIPVPGDYDGDGKTDFAVWRRSTGIWFVIPSSNPSVPIMRQWGTNGDIPVPGDYDGDGKTDFAVWRPSTGVWFIIPSSNPRAPILQQWGTNGDIPVPGDYDGDDKTDVAVWRPSLGVWFIIPSSNPGAPILQQWGTNGDIPVPLDYDGDRQTDFAVWRPSSGTWFVIPSSTPANFTVTQWGTSTDVLVQKPIGQ